MALEIGDSLCCGSCGHITVVTKALLAENRKRRSSPQDSDKVPWLRCVRCKGNGFQVRTNIREPLKQHESVELKGKPSAALPTKTETVGLRSYLPLQGAQVPAPDSHRRLPAGEEISKTESSDARAEQGLWRAALQRVAKGMSSDERQATLLWAQELAALANDKTVSNAFRAGAAVRVTVNRKIVWPFLREILRALKQLGWNERGLKARLAMSAGAISAVAFGGQAAGIAALGGAIGVPLWLVFAGGGALLGAVIEELRRRD